MNKTRLYVAIMASLPFAAFSLGMGDMTVESSLNQPFKAEIQLIDVDIPLTGIKARLASVEDFERIGLDRNEILTLLRFEIKKNEKGQTVIYISSYERIIEPFLEIVVDLTWADGQLYRAYTVLLDPPGYQLNGGVKATGSPVKFKSYNNEPGVVNKPSYAHMVEQGSETSKSRKEATYGPTVANESIWQIAQRYTTPDTTIQQVILAIVGTNSQAFTQGNLNGLKAGERLRIPSSDEVKKVPEDLARGEVEAHDLAWKNKEEIKHVLLPPYIDGVAGKSQFENKPTDQPPVNPANGENPSNIPQAPVFNQQKTSNGNTFTDIFSTADSMMSAAEDTKKPASTDKQPVKADSAIKAEMDVTNAAIDSMRLVNSQLKNQLQSLEKDNKVLQEQMSKRDEDIKQLREQMKLLLKQRQAVAAQTSQQPAEDESSNLWLYLILILAAGGIGAFSWFFLKQKTNRPGSLSGPDAPSKNDNPPPPLKPLLQSEPTETKSTETGTAIDSATVSKPEETVSIQQAVIEPASSHVAKVQPEQPNESMVVIPPKENEADEADVAFSTTFDEPDTPVEAPQDSSENEHENQAVQKLEADFFASTEDAEKEEKVLEKKEFRRPLSDLVKSAADYPVEITGVESQLHEATEQFAPDEAIAPTEKEETKPEDFVLDFEPSLEKMVEENKQKQEVVEQIEQATDEGLDFIPTPIEVKTEEKTITSEENTGDDNALDFEAGLTFEPAKVEPEKTERPVIESPEIDELLKSTEGDEEDEGPVIDFDGLVEEQSEPDNALPLELAVEKKSKKTAKDQLADKEDFEVINLDSGEENNTVSVNKDSEEDNEFDFEAEFAEEAIAGEQTPAVDSAIEAVGEIETVEEKEIADETNEEEQAVTPEETDKKLVKSKKALDTLMALAKTYISMDDNDAARQSLQEIVEYGNKKQRTEAQKLLDEMDKK